TKKHKKRVNTVDELTMLKSIMKKEAFYDKFEVSMDVVSKMAAMDAMAADAISGIEMTGVERKELMNGEWKNVNY
ncbi:MAG: hypothetical protein ACTSX1_04840, partial [Candidatus Heimdallarchaeaceae archaeon]